MRGDLSGTMNLHGQGTLDGLTVGGNLSGTITAPEDSNAGSGQVSNVSAGSMSGTIDTGAVKTMTVTGDLSGTMYLHGQGTLDGLTVGGNLSGTITAPEDSNAGSGQVSNVSAGSMSGTI